MKKLLLSLFLCSNFLFAIEFEIPLFQNKSFEKNDRGEFTAREISLVKVNDTCKFSFENFNNGLLVDSMNLPLFCGELKNTYRDVHDIRKQVFIIEKYETFLENQKTSLVEKSITLIKFGKMCGFRYENLKSSQRVQLENNKIVILPTYEVVEIMNDCKSIVEKL